MDAIFAWDESVLLWIQDNLRNDVLTPIFKFITKLGDGGMFWIVLSLLLIILPKYRKVGFTCALSMILTLLVVNVGIKNVVARIRPYETIEGLTRLVPIQSDFSFPSGHTSHAFAVGVVVLILMNKKIGIPIFCLSVIMGFSRLYVGVHYPTDVICGALIGSVLAVASIFIVKTIDKKIHKPEEITQEIQS